jgi:hypothetical protein
MTSLKDFPRVDTPITTSYGRGTVQKLDIFQDLVWIQYEDGTWEEKPLQEIRELLGMAESASMHDMDVADSRGGGGNGRGRS